MAQADHANSTRRAFLKSAAKGVAGVALLAAGIPALLAAEGEEIDFARQMVAFFDECPNQWFVPAYEPARDLRWYVSKSYLRNYPFPDDWRSIILTEAHIAPLRALLKT